MKKTGAGSAALIVGILGGLATICAALIGAGATILGPVISSRRETAQVPPTQIVLTVPAATTEAPWVPGMRHPEYPHVIASQTRGDWHPEAGYDWVSSKPGDLRVEWKAGLEDPDHPNIVSSDKEGNWQPASGYKWANPDNPDELAVVPVLGKIETVTVDHNTVEGGQKGMRIHIKFSVEQMQEIRCNIGAYFFYATGQTLAARPGDTVHMASAGQLAVAEDFTPPYESTRYADYTLFLPYDAINIDPGISKVDMKFKARLYNWRDKSFITESDFFSFTYSH